MRYINEKGQWQDGSISGRNDRREGREGRKIGGTGVCR